MYQPSISSSPSWIWVLLLFHLVDHKNTTQGACVGFHPFISNFTAHSSVVIGQVYSPYGRIQRPWFCVTFAALAAKCLMMPVYWLRWEGSDASIKFVTSSLRWRLLEVSRDLTFIAHFLICFAARMILGSADPDFTPKLRFKIVCDDTKIINTCWLRPLSGGDYSESGESIGYGS